MLTPVLKIGEAQVFLCRSPALAHPQRDMWLSEQLSTALCTPLQIVRRSSGRPALANPHHELGISMAHAGGFLALGVNLQASVGIDLELTRAAQGMTEIAKNQFHADEVTALIALRADERDEKALQLWVMKEAILKLSGRGVFDGMSEPNLAPFLNALNDENPQFEIVHHSLWHEPLHAKCSFKRVDFEGQSAFLAVAYTSGLID